MNNSPLLLDTHVWIWLMLGHKNISTDSKKRINAAAKRGHVFISAISVWELAMLEAKERVILRQPCMEWVNHSLEELGIELVPLLPSIAIESAQLPDGFHGDPADRIIVATARIQNLTLITCDQKILDYGKKKYLHAIPT